MNNNSNQLIELDGSKAVIGIYGCYLMQIPKAEKVITSISFSEIAAINSRFKKECKLFDLSQKQAEARHNKMPIS